MATMTKNLNLFKYDVEADKDQKFDITKALNENWDKIDALGAEVAKLNAGELATAEVV